jgi:hypothetical protein
VRIAFVVTQISQVSLFTCVPPHAYANPDRLYHVRQPADFIA